MTPQDTLNELLEKLNNVKSTYDFVEICDDNENNTIEHLNETESNVLEIADVIIDILLAISEYKKELLK